ncbi:MAG: hypothetical protein JNM79_02250, partial [Burkholderiales bacterium]|nr:hypothetical protein [Burkholderiales bacterium]
MFEWLTKIVDDARIAFAYIKFEKECRKQWVADAERTYSTVLIENKIEFRMAEPSRHAAIAFDGPIRDLESRCEGIRQGVADANDKLAILDRDYKSELDSAYIVLNQVRAELESCRQNLASAHSELNSAKSSLNAWYSRAERRWFGNRGRELPRHSFFGQDLRDRDHLKSRRDGAAHDVGRYKSEREKIASRLEAARADLPPFGRTTVNSESPSIRENDGHEKEQIQRRADHRVHQAGRSRYGG